MKPLTIEQKIFLLLILIGILANIFTNGAKAQTVKRAILKEEANAAIVTKGADGIYTSVSARSVKTEDKDTGLKFKDATGHVNAIFEGKRGGHYYLKTDKNGKKTKQYPKLNEK